MCGVLGFHFAQDAVPPEQQAHLLWALARENETRGSQSWGIYAPNLDIYERDTGRITNGLLPWRFARTDIVVAHTRFATHGSVSKENAHPFRVDGLVGLHNGVVSNHKELLIKYGRTFEVDSLHILAHIAEGRSLEDIEAYGSVQWILDGENHVNLTHFNGGELAIAIIPEKGLVWSSTSRHLTTALEEAGLREGVRWYKLKEDLVYWTSPQALYYNKDPLKVGRPSYQQDCRDFDRWMYDFKDDKVPWKKCESPPPRTPGKYKLRERLILTRMIWPTSSNRKNAASAYCEWNQEMTDTSVSACLNAALEDARYMEEVEGWKQEDIAAVLKDDERTTT